MALRQRKPGGCAAPPRAAPPPPCRRARRPAAADARALAALLLAAAAALLLRRSFSPALPPYLRPFPGPRLAALPQFAGAHAARLLWGTLRPGLYFGLRARLPASPLVGLMWVDPGRPDALDALRHEARQEDGLRRYGWAAHDGAAFGRQELADRGMRLTTAWVKRSECDGTDAAGSKSSAAACAPGRDWAARVSAVADGSDADAPPAEAVSFIVYVTDEAGGPVALDPQTRTLSGSAPGLGRWALRVSGADPAASATRFLGLRTPHTHNLTAAARAGLVASLRAQLAADPEGRALALWLPNAAERGANVAMLQITGRLPLTLDLAFLGSPAAAARPASLAADALAAALSGAALTARLATAEAAFEARFAATFGAAAAAPAAARAALANLLGGLGYWHGRSLVKAPAAGGEDGTSSETASSTAAAAPPRESWAAPLFSATPSRPFFPRGFLWDEGFHQLLLRRWDPALARDALAHWLDLVSASGWVAREQILGEEARARVPGEFLAQSPDVANPPTLLLVLEQMADGGGEGDGSAPPQSPEDAALDRDFLAAAWPRVRAWAAWLNATQAGGAPGAYRWRGRDAGAARELNAKTLASGLDDYPRASHPDGGWPFCVVLLFIICRSNRLPTNSPPSTLHPLPRAASERHLDLRCWLALAARAAAAVAAAARAPPAEAAPWAALATRLADYEELKALHWDAPNQRFADYGLHTDDVALVFPGSGGLIYKQNTPGEAGEAGPKYDAAAARFGEPLRAVIGAPPAPRFVPHTGYVSLFPLLLRLLPPAAPELGAALTALRDPAQLWSPAGLRSLSKASPLYAARNTRHDPPYWRGAVWVNINYMALRALRHYGAAPGPHAAAAATAAADLRAALLGNVARRWEESGFLWEQYDGEGGEGRGCRPFAGWTALLALAAAEK